MKIDRTLVGHNTERGVEVKTYTAIGVGVQNTDGGDTTTSVKTLITAEQVEEVP